MYLVGKFDKKTCDEFENGQTAEYPTEWIFMQTDAGFLSPNEIAKIIWSHWKDKPFMIRVSDYEGELPFLTGHSRLKTAIASDIINTPSVGHKR